MGVGRILSRGDTRVFSKICVGGAKVAKFGFSHSKLRKPPFLLEFSNSMFVGRGGAGDHGLSAHPEMFGC